MSTVLFLMPGTCGTHDARESRSCHLSGSSPLKTMDTAAERDFGSVRRATEGRYPDESLTEERQSTKSKDPQPVIILPSCQSRVLGIAQSGIGRGELHPEFTSFADFRFNAESSAHALHGFGDDRKSDPGAIILLLIPKPFEDTENLAVKF